VLVLGLTAGDYLLWNWSLSGSRDIPALISGLTLPPLLAACLLLLATTIGRVLARSARRSTFPAPIQRDGEARSSPPRHSPAQAPPPPGPDRIPTRTEPAPAPASSRSRRRPARRVAA
jgi:hypothetical protein